MIACWPFVASKSLPQFSVRLSVTWDRPFKQCVSHVREMSKISLRTFEIERNKKREERKTEGKEFYICACVNLFSGRGMLRTFNAALSWTAYKHSWRCTGLFVCLFRIPISGCITAAILPGVLTISLHLDSATITFLS